MQIAYNGFGSFTLTFKPALTDVTLVTNPFLSDSVKFKPVAASLCVESHDGKDANNAKEVQPEHPDEGQKVFVVTHPGEYEVRGVFVTGIDAPKKDGTPHAIYRFDSESVHIGFLGALDRELTEKEIDQLGPIDILILPAGGKTVLNASQAGEIISQIEPRMVIPSYVNGEDGYGTADALKRELSCPTEEVSKLKIVKAGLPEEDMKLVTFSK